MLLFFVFQQTIIVVIVVFLIYIANVSLKLRQSPKMEKKVTIYDIAKKLDITAATVSRALNNSPRISVSTKELVKETADKMNYEQNTVAQALKSGKTYNIGVIVPRINSNFFSSVIRGIEEELQKSGYNIIICQSYEKAKVEEECINTLLKAKVDGILVSTTPNSKKTSYNSVIQKGIPLVFFDRRKKIKGVSSVTIDDFNAGYISTIHLVQQGFKNIAHFRGDYSIEIFKQRYMGYKQALIDSGLEIRKDYVVKTNSTIQDGKNAVRRLMNLDVTPDAIFSSSDFNALGAIKELKSLGYNVPNEIGVVGFSNEPFTNFVELTISTVNQFPIEMGEKTAVVLLEQINSDKHVKPKEVVISPKLLIRDSSLKKVDKNFIKKPPFSKV